ncbi:MAG: MaoC family dehydratase N-terminal domain-containing protein [Nocardioides sp.]|nr:MaoC family dehydratase N-terminal domain-containing protein [Nocardioides sp.]
MSTDLTPDLTPGAALPEQVFTVTRADLVAYAEASGDHNPIHQDEEVALGVGLPGVIAHGMYTLALSAARSRRGPPERRSSSWGRSSPAPSSYPPSAEPRWSSTAR